MTSEWGPVIDSYSRADAIADGVLVDVTSVAKEAGILYPTAITQAVWSAYVAVPSGVECQDEAGRLWDIVYMFAMHARRGSGPRADEMRYRLYVRNDNRRPKLVTLKAICGPGDDGEPVITIMMPNED